MNDFDVDAALRGAVATRSSSLTLLADYRVVFRRRDAAATDQVVAVISGGGAGHEPAHVGFVGPTMLAAAVSGGVYASPSPAQVTAAIAAVAHANGPGVLLIVKNYTGDRLSFGLAAARWQQQHGAACELLVVGDNCALPTALDRRRTGRRGLAGTVLVHKIIGHCAAVDRMALPQLRSIGEAVVSRLGTAALSFEAGGMAVLGRGIHGEPGAATVSAPPTAQHTARQLLQTIINGPAPLVLDDTDAVALLVNNAGAAADGAVNALVDAALTELAAMGRRVDIIVAGRLMTSIGMNGVSLTLLALDTNGRFAEALLAPAPGTAWPGATQVSLPLLRHIIDSAPATTPIMAPPTAPARKLIGLVTAAAQALVDNADMLNALDAKIGDGDCGTTMQAAGHAVLRRFAPSSAPSFTSFSGLLGHIADALDTAALVGGSSGVLYQIGLVSASSAIAQSPTLLPSRSDVHQALKAATDAIQHYGGAQHGDRTMLDVLLPVQDALIANPTSSLADLRDVARTGYEATAQMPIARAGRASYAPEGSLVGVGDPGACAVLCWMNAILGLLAEEDPC